MESFNRNVIVKDYVRALYQRNLSLLTARSEGIKEYYTLDARPKIYAQINEVANMESSIERAEINHNLKLHFYSADGQLVSFTDRFVESRERVKTKEGQLLASKIDYADFSIIMQLDDGYWRIKHMVRMPPNIIADTLTVDSANRKAFYIEKLKGIKGINYYPRETPWKDFWIKYDSATTQKDFQLIKQLGFNNVRIFVNYEQFGKGNVVPEMILRLQNLLNTATVNNLSVIVTLFDFNSNYSLLNFPATDRQLETLLTTFKNHPALLAWDLKNEADLDFFYQNREEVKEWLRFIIKKAKKYDSVHPLTVGWAYPENADYLADEFDFVSFHYYKEPHKLGEAIDSLRKKINNKPLVLGEFGLSSYRSKVFPYNKTETQQVEYFRDIQNVLKQKGNIPSIYWTLYDFTSVPSDIAGWRPWQRNNQKYFGIVRSDGSLKKIGNFILHPEEKINKSILELFPQYLILYSIILFLLLAAFIKRNYILSFLNSILK
ncbi:MAG: cellulase family glycosylhydrolase [Emticicia sp.]|uniref:cellulase family glycosylhydrolase n=1 Tax=Emticicia sp. TaxID=1930953 RepID=UPI003BA7FD56